jgi:hypothetical protein
MLIKNEHSSYEVTHAELVELAARWLSTKGYPIVITEMVSYAGEIPDAIGLNSHWSHLIECKVSRSDFLADSKKNWRKTGWKSFGCSRSYLCPKGMIDPKELPEHWGLIECFNGKLREIVKPSRVAHPDHDFKCEFTLLVSALRRIGQTLPVGISVKCYNIETQSTATIGIEPETVIAEESTPGSGS